MKSLKVMVCLVLAGFSLASVAQERLRGAVVWEYDDESILVRYNGVDRYYAPLDGEPGPGPGPGRCDSLPTEPPLGRDTQLYRQTIVPARTAGGTEYGIDLSQFHYPKRIQLRVLRGVVQVHGAELVKRYEGYEGLPELTVNRLCEGQSKTVTLNGAANTLTSLNLSMGRRTH